MNRAEHAACEKEIQRLSKLGKNAFGLGFLYGFCLGTLLTVLTIGTIQNWP